MAQYPQITLTNSGLNMIAESQGGTELIFTKMIMGDGELVSGEDIKALMSVKNAMLTVPVQGFLNQGEGQVRLRFSVSNETLNTGFFAREIGVYAKLGEFGIEQLYAYTNAGNKSDYMPDKSIPLDSQILDLYIIVGNSSSISAILDSNAAYATKMDLEEHSTSPDAHNELFKKFRNSEAIGHIGFAISNIPDGCLTLDTGALISRETYPELWAFVQSDRNLLQVVTDNEWQTMSENQTSVAAFSTGDGNITFRLPRLIGWAKGGVQEEVGSAHEAGLPNIRGEFGTQAYSPTEVFNTSEIVKTDRKMPNTAISDATSWFEYMIAFNASKANTIYGASNEVQPVGFTGVYYIRAFHGVINEGIVDITALASEKADTSLSNLSATGKSEIAKLGMPSATFETLTYREKGRYTAPANGYFYLFQNISGFFADFGALSVLNVTTGIECRDRYWHLGSENTSMLVLAPVRKGDIVECSKFQNNVPSIPILKFYYAEGEI